MRRLLLIACSQRKVTAPGLLPALERYDGPAFRVLRKYLREGGGDGLSILVLSAKYGLIAADHAIPDYDCRLTRESARDLRGRVLEAARVALASAAWRAVGVCAGKDYRIALDGVSGLVPAGVAVDLIEGGQGPRLTALKKWLLQSN
jgi:hypothetical protein